MALHSAQKDSPSTYLTEAVDNVTDTLAVADSLIFQHQPGIGDVTRLTLGFDTATTETVTVTSYASSNRIVIERGTPAYSWGIGTKIARVLTAQDINEILGVLENLGPRTRSFLVPVFAGDDNMSTFAFGGLSLSLDTHIAYANFSVPKDFLSNMTVTPAFVGTPAGECNYWVRRSIVANGQYSIGDMVDTPSTNIIINPLAVFPLALKEGTPIVLSSAALGDYVLLMLERNSQVGSIYLTGFLVSYTARF